MRRLPLIGNFSNRKLLLFSVAFALLGSFIVWRTFAAVPIVATVESETMTPSTGVAVINDATASAGKAIALNGVSGGAPGEVYSATGSVTLDATTKQIIVRAKGDQCIGAPQMQVKLDGTQIVNLAVPASGWTDYPVALNIAGSTTARNLSVSFTNDFDNIAGNSGKLKCSRNLYVDKLTFTGEVTSDVAVNITYPINGGTYSGGMPIEAKAISSSGISKVEFYLDGTLTKTDNASPYCLESDGGVGTPCTPWDSNKVANGSHTLTAYAYDTAGNKSSANNVVFTVNNTVSTPVIVTKIDDNTIGTGSNQFQYTGSWTLGTSASHSSGIDHYSGATGAYATLKFYGTQVKLYSNYFADHGIAGISIDGGAETTVDTYGPSTYQALIYTSPVFPEGTHTLKIRVTGTKNASSTGINVAVDTAEVISTTVPPTNPDPIPPTPGWELLYEDNFDGTTINTSTVVDLANKKSGWHLYGPYPGHGQNGIRTPASMSVDGKGNLVITAHNVNGVIESGGMSNYTYTKYGRFETRVRTEIDPTGTMSGVILTWPWDGTSNLLNGENDFYETLHPKGTRTPFKSFIHYPNSATGSEQTAWTHNSDGTQWHKVVMEWAPIKNSSGTIIDEYINIKVYKDDGTLVSDNTLKESDDPSRENIPNIAHRVCIQLDQFQEQYLLTQDVHMYVDYMRVYKNL